MSKLAIEEDAGFGALTTERGVLPLKAMDIHAEIDGLVSAVSLRQTFVNVFDVPLEATYIFPLPDRAAVQRFRLEVAGRVVEGVLRERGEARRTYDQAIEQGHRAAIAEEERPGVFTMRVGNLPAGETATVELTLSGPLPCDNGEATFRFPLVVAPRYVPGTPLPGPSVGDGIASDTDAVPDGSRIAPPVLLPGFPNPVRLSLIVDVMPSDCLGDYRSSLHAVLGTRDDSGTRRIVLQGGERLDRDFILRFTLGDAAVRTSLALHADGPDEGTFALTIVPPRTAEQGRPRDIVFVLDRSGSMSGWKMTAARRALAHMVETLHGTDRFAIYAFDNTVETPAGDASLVAANPRERARAVQFLETIGARGGTEMAQPLALAARTLAGEGMARDRILVLVTDGQVGGEDQILRSLGDSLRAVRVFTLGIDRAVNAGFLRRLADLGGGTCELVESEDRLNEVLTTIHRRIAAPVLTDLRLRANGFEIVADTLTPSQMPDLFSGTPLCLMGRYRGDPAGAVTIAGRTPDGETWSGTTTGRRSSNAALPAVWARGHVRDLEDRFVVRGNADLERRITETSLRFGVLCRFTAFVAVDRAEVVNEGGEQHRVTRAVEPVRREQSPRLRGLPAAKLRKTAFARNFHRCAPPLLQMKIDPANIGQLIGPGGKTIKGIQESTGTKIDICDDGTVQIAAANAESGEAAKEQIQALQSPPGNGRKISETSKPSVAPGGLPERDNRRAGAAPRRAERPQSDDAEVEGIRSRTETSQQRERHQDRQGRGGQKQQNNWNGESHFAAIRKRTRALLEMWKNSTNNHVATCLTDLSNLVEKLTALIKDLQSVGASTNDIKPLKNLLADLRSLLAETSPDAAEVARLWTEAEKVVRAFCQG